jgi:ABC-type dipeptide/oligopeptide/nickel transport system permease subunit
MSQINDPGMALVATTAPGAASDPSPTEPVETFAPARGWREMWARARRSQLMMIGAVTVIIIALLCVVLPFMLPFDPLSTDISKRLIAPMWFANGLEGHVLGTDPLGRDILTRLAFGGRTSLIIAFSVVAITTIVGLVLGLLAGYYGGVLDVIVMRLCDLGLALPSLLLAIAVVAAIGGGVVNLIVVLSVTGWIMTARIVRSTVIQVRSMEFVQAAKVFAQPSRRIIFGEIMPNIAAPTIISATQHFGGMIASGREYLASSPWVVIVPGVALMITVLAVTFVGDGLNDILNPQLSHAPNARRRRNGGSVTRVHKTGAASLNSTTTIKTGNL